VHAEPPAAPAMYIDPTTEPRFPILVPEREIVAETPGWSPATVDRNAREVESAIYEVKAGDSLFGIAYSTGAGASAIADANALVPPYALRAGQRLHIPAGLYHRVGANETGIAIARAYGVNWADVVALNRLPPPYVLQVGQNLRLSDLGASAASGEDRSPEQRAAAFALDIDAIVTGSAPARSAAVARAAPNTNFAGAFVWPLSGTVLVRFGSLGGGRASDGIKIAGAEGASVGAAGDGIVVYAGNEISVLGGLVLVDHGTGWVTAYGHLGSLDVAKGDRVKSGQKVGSVGDTGYVDRPQLHFEIRKDRQPLDPLTRLPNR
jgi:murein DD-endopeptidase MepM/ murein hydrolase activator NlpD